MHAQRGTGVVCKLSKCSRKQIESILFFLDLKNLQVGCAFFNAAGEQAAIRLYAEIVTDPDIGADLYTEIENVVEISNNQEDEILAMGIKLRISKILFNTFQVIVI